MRQWRSVPFKYTSMAAQRNVTQKCVSSSRPDDDSAGVRLSDCADYLPHQPSCLCGGPVRCVTVKAWYETSAYERAAYMPTTHMAQCLNVHTLLTVLARPDS